MKITKNKNNETMASNLNCGELVIFEERYYLVANNGIEEDVMLVDIEDGNIIHITINMSVDVVNAEVVIRD